MSLTERVNFLEEEVAILKRAIHGDTGTQRRDRSRTPIRRRDRSISPLPPPQHNRTRNRSRSPIARRVERNKHTKTEENLRSIWVNLTKHRDLTYNDLNAIFKKYGVVNKIIKYDDRRNVPMAKVIFDSTKDVSNCMTSVEQIREIYDMTFSTYRE